MDSAILRDSLLDYARIIRARANAFAELPSATDRDRQTLAENEKRLATSVEALVRIVDNHDALVLWAAAVSPKLRPKDRAALGALKPVVLDGLADLSGAISAAMHIGANCFDSPIYKQMAKDERAKRMRSGRRSKAQLLADIWKLAEPVLKEHPDLKAPEVAAAITVSFHKGQMKPVKNTTLVRRVNEAMVEHGRRARQTRRTKTCTAG